MSSFNKVILAGHITRDPEVRYTPKGTTVAKFALAMNREWKDTAGNEREEVVSMDGIEYVSGCLIFNRYEHDSADALEFTVMEVLADAVMSNPPQSINRYMRDVEAELSLPPGSLVRLPADEDL